MYCTIHGTSPSTTDGKNCYFCDYEQKSTVKFPSHISINPNNKTVNSSTVIPTKPTSQKEIDNMKQRKYLPTLSELLDRLTIVQQKELKIPQNRKEYTQELNDIVCDIEFILRDDDRFGHESMAISQILRDVIILTLMNCEIWHNESQERLGKGDGSGLRLSHSLNGIRNTAKNKIQDKFGGRKDYKIDSCRLYKEWEPSGYSLEEHNELQKTISETNEENKK